MSYPSYDRPTPEQPRRWISDATIDNWTAYHPPTGGKVGLHEAIRKQFNELLKWLNEVLPEGPDKTNALHVCRHAMNAANTAVACNPLESEVDEYYTRQSRDEREHPIIIGVDDRQVIPHQLADNDATQVIPAVRTGPSGTQLIPRPGMKDVD